MPVSKTVDRGSNPRGPAHRKNQTLVWFFLCAGDGAMFWLYLMPKPRVRAGGTYERERISDLTPPY